MDPIENEPTYREFQKHAVSLPEEFTATRALFADMTQIMSSEQHLDTDSTTEKVIGAVIAAITRLEARVVEIEATRRSGDE